MSDPSTRYIVDYFKGEQQESYLFIAAGLIAIVAAYFAFFVVQKPLYVGAAVPVSIIGLIELIVGASMAAKTNNRIKNLLEVRASNPSQFKANEIQRMDTALNHFKIYRTIEQVLFISGLIFVVLGLSDKISKYMAGVGVGLMLQSSVMLFLDLFAELRAKEYIRRLSKEE